MRFPNWLTCQTVKTARKRRTAAIPNRRQALVSQIEALECRAMLTAPTLAAISDVTLQSGSPLHIALDGFDADGDELTFSAVSNDALVTTSITTGNRSLRLTVEEFGEMVFELFEDQVPRATNRIIELAQAGFYEGIIFHRVIDEFVIQAGDPTGTGSGGSELGDFDDQFDVNLQHNSTGLLSMAKSFDDTNDSQFFITEGPSRHLDFNHSIFGFMVEGESVRDAISNVAVDSDDIPLEDVVISSAEVFFDTENGVLVLSAAEGTSGPADITVTVTDENGETAQRTFHVTVQPDTFNSHPFLADIPTITTTVDTPVTYQLAAIDAEGDTTPGEDVFFLDEELLQINDLPVPFVSHADLDYIVELETGLMTISPKNGLTGTFQVIVAAGRSSSALDYQAVTVVIGDGPGAPILSGPTGTITDTTPTFSWNAVGGADHYDLWVDNISAEIGQVIRQQTLTTTSFTPTTALPEGAYRVWVRGISAGGDEGAWSTAVDFTIVADLPAPGKVTLTGPAATTGATPTITWNAVNNADHYDVWVDNDSTGTSEFIRNENVSGVSFSTGSPWPAGNYRVWVRAVNSQGEAGIWSSARSFTIDAGLTPGRPTLTEPTSVTDDSTPTIRWTAASNADHYEIWIDSVSTNQSELIRDADIDGTSYTTAINLPDGNYRVWVRAINGSGDAGAWSASRNFTVNSNVPVPSAPTFTGPMGTILTSSTTIMWNGVLNADHYDLWVDNRSTGATEVIRQQNLSSTSYMTGNLANGNYRAWVRAINSEGAASPWSAAANFTIATPGVPAAPTLIGPSGTIDTSRPVVSWTETTNAVQYDLWIDNLSTNQMRVVRKQDLTGTSYQVTKDLPDGMYVMWIRAINSVGSAGEWSTELEFTINTDVPVPGRPVLTSPPKTTSDATPEIAWGAVEFADHYDVWIDNRSTGATEVVRNMNVASNSYSPSSELPVGNYRIWVRAVNQQGEEGMWSALRDFTIVDDVPHPAAPVVNGPTGTTTDSTPTFSWQAVAVGERYDLWVDNTTTGDAEVIRNMQITSTSYTPTAELPTGNYRYWVRAFNSEGESGPWSTAKNFTIADDLPTPERPTITGPTGATTAAPPEFVWGSVANADHYDVWVRNLTTNVDEYHRNENVAGTSYSPGSAFPVGNYRVWVRAINVEGDISPWSPPHDFSVVSAAPFAIDIAFLNLEGLLL